MSHIIANKLSLIKPSPTLSITARAIELKRQGHDIISLSVGEPDFDTPDSIKQGAIDAIKSGKTKYTAVDGIAELKTAVVKKFNTENGLKYITQEVTIGSGAKQVLFNVLFATLNPGDEVIIPAPYWVSYVDMVAIAQGKAVIVECKPQDNFKLTASLLEAAITDKTKWLILNSPNNPSGEVYTEYELTALINVLKKYPHVLILSDDIYEHIIFDGKKFVTILQLAPELKDRVFIINGVSKAYSMTGWRIGYGAGSSEIIKAISVIQSQSTSNPCSVSQYAALSALTGPQDFIPQNAALFQKRRDLIVHQLNAINGVHCPTPDGAFYVFADCTKFIGKSTPNGNIIKDSVDVAAYLLSEAMVAVIPGSAFGIENYIRISYAVHEDAIEKACSRIKQACHQLD